MEIEVKKLWTDPVYDIWWDKGWDNYARIQIIKENNTNKVKQIAGIKIPPKIWTLILIIFTKIKKQQ